MHLPILKLFFQKLLTAPLCIAAAFGGMFGFAVVLSPLNLPYLLKFNEDVMAVVYVFLGVLFLSVATAMVRTQHLRSSDLFEANPEKSLFVRVVTSKEYLMEQLVFVLLMVSFSVWMWIREQVGLAPLLLGAAILTIGGEILFAAMDCLIWIISFKSIRR